MAVAQRLAGSQILAVDAMQVYRGMDIGTAKPTLSDQALVPHHGIDLVETHELFTVADFQRHARGVTEVARAASSPLLMVAGTGLYLTAVIDGLDPPRGMAAAASRARTTRSGQPV